MINFRFHLISLIAVFLALALGVVMGYGILGQPTVETLQNRIDTVAARADRVRGENDALRKENERLANAMKSVDDFAVTNRLNNTGVLPVAARGVNEDQVIEFVRLARNGGAPVPGVVWLEEKWGLTNSDDIAELGAIVGSTATNRGVMRDVAARALATRLAGGPTPAGRPDLLTQLDDGGFIGIQEVGGLRFDPATLDERGGTVLAIGGTSAALTPDRSTTPLARALGTVAMPVIVADDWRQVEGGPERGAALAGILDDDTLKNEVATFDAFDTVDGPLVAVLVIGDRRQGTIGHYGFGRGADNDVPEWWRV